MRVCVYVCARVCVSVFVKKVIYFSLFKTRAEGIGKRVMTGPEKGTFRPIGIFLSFTTLTFTGIKWDLFSARYQRFSVQSYRAGFTHL